MALLLHPQHLLELLVLDLVAHGVSYVYLYIGEALELLMIPLTDGHREEELLKHTLLMILSVHDAVLADDVAAEHAPLLVGVEPKELVFQRSRTYLTLFLLRDSLKLELGPSDFVEVLLSVEEIGLEDLLQRIIIDDI